MTKIIRSLGVLLGLWCLVAGAHAEGNCPPGSFPIGGGSAGWTGCAPAGGSQRKAPVTPAEQWEDRYGSIASDAERGVYQSVTDMTSIAAAERAAMANCKSKGGRNCEILLTYHNGCAAIVFGDTVYLAQTGPTIAAANQKALNQCSAATKNCHVEFNVCSMPVRLQ